MKHFNMEVGPKAYALENRQQFLKNLGADFWSDTVRPDAFHFYRPTFTGAMPTEPYAPDSEMFYAVDIKCKQTTVEGYNYTYTYLAEAPFADLSTVEELRSHTILRKLEQFDFSKMVGSISGEPITTTKEKDFISMGSLNSFFMLCSYLRGMEAFLMDIAVNTRFAEYLIDMVGEFVLEFARREMESFADKAEFYCDWDDFAGQDGPMISPDMFKKYFLPLYQKLIANVKKHDLYFTWHCCGSVHKLMPHMIDAGVDVFEVCQTSAKDMDLETVHKMYGRNVCIHGAIDVQKLLVHQKPGQIGEEVKKIFDLWGYDGGIVIAPSHAIHPGTPIDNILAIYEAVREENERRRA